MILVVAAGASVLVALLRGGRLAWLAEWRLRGAWLVLVAVALQFPLVYNMLGGAVICGAPVTHLALGVSWVLLFTMAWLNRRRPPVLLIALGMLCNLLVMVLNGGWMPIAPEALARMGRLQWVESTGIAAKIPGTKNVMLARAETRLWWLSDVFVLAPPLPLAAFSAGDILIALGMFWLLQDAFLRRGERAVR